MKRKEVRLNTIVPNFVTFAAAASGLTSIRFTVEGRYELAILAVLIAAVLDGMDGRIARMMRGGSQFGVELDSLSDFLNFGIAPAFILYSWSLYNLNSIGWAIAIFLALCCEMRLARFNTMLSDTVPPYWKNFFMGMPAPLGGLISLSPVMMYLYDERPIWADPYVIAGFALVSGALMASRIPTLSLKRLKVDSRYLFPLFLAAMAMVGALCTRPWLTLGGFFILYVACVPLMGLYFLKAKLKYERERAKAE